MAESIPKLVPTQFHDRTGWSSPRLQVAEQNRYLGISVCRLQDTEETEQVKEQDRAHRFQFKEDTAHRLQVTEQEKVLIQI
jgi:hypothetical protein